jgi:large subunit ribosomal protein L6
MSRVGKYPVTVPSDVKVEVDGRRVKFTGPLGNQVIDIHKDVEFKFEEGQMSFAPANDTKFSRSMWGTTKSLVAAMVEGVKKGYEQKLEIQGVGYRASLDNQGLLTLFLGFSHEVKYAIPEGIKIVCDKPTAISIKGISKQLVGQVASEIRKLKLPEPYKGKGVRFEGEKIRMKEGKKK